MTNNDDNELMRRFRALRETDSDTHSQIKSSSTPSLIHEKQQQQEQHETLKYFNKIPNNNLPWNQKDKDKSTEKIQPMHVEENLSQKMSQLSTQTKIENDHETLLKNVQIDMEKIPNYLTKRNKSFQQMLNSILTIIKLNDKDKMEDLRKIAILIYKIRFIQAYQHLWTFYLKAGVGQLSIQPTKPTLTYQTNRPIWSKEIKTMVQATMKINEENEYECCFHFVQFYLQILEDQFKKYQSELKIKMNDFQGYSSTIQRQIETYIEQNFHFLRMEIEHKIQLIQYDYHIHAIKLEYFRHQPNSFQEQIMKELCISQYQHKTTEQELNFLKQQIIYYNNTPKQSFEQSPIAHCSAIDSIQDPTIRQPLFQQYKHTAIQARADIFHLYLKAAEEERDEYKKKFHDNMKTMYSTRNSSIETEKSPQIMIDLIIRRCEKIRERIKCLYEFKKNQFMIANSKQLS